MDRHDKLMTTRDKIFWILWVIIALAAILFTIKVSGDSFPTQGSGAYDLIRNPTFRATDIPEPLMVTTQSYRNFYFAAIATNSVGQSDYSNEAVYTRTSAVSFVTLKWDAPEGDSVEGYILYWGKASGLYTNKTYWGTNLIATVRIIPAMPSNLVVSVTETNASNIAWSSSPNGPWSTTGFSKYTTTNPVGPRYFRAYGSKNNSKVFISKTMQ